MEPENESITFPSPPATHTHSDNRGYPSPPRQSAVSPVREGRATPLPCSPPCHAAASRSSASGSKARAARFQAFEGEVLTPIFMPVGMQTTVKSMSADELEAVGSHALPPPEH